MLENRYNNDNLTRLVNKLSGLGDPNVDASVATKISRSSSIIDLETLDAAYQLLWPCRKVCDFHPQAMAREWGEFVLASDTRKKAGKIMDRVTKFFDQARQIYELGQKMANKHGGSLCIRYIDDGRDFAEPVDTKNIKSFEYSRIFERWEISPYPVTSLKNDDPFTTYGYSLDPEYYWYSTGANKYKKIHRDRVIRFRGEFTGYRPLNLNQGWEDSLLVKFLEPCLNYIEPLKYVSTSVKSFEVVIYLIQSLFEYFDDEASHNRLIERLNLNQRSMSTLKGLVADKESEDVKILSRQYSGVSDIIEKLKEEMVAASGLTKPQLLSEHPTGLSATGLSERLAEADVIKAKQNSLWLNLINKDIEYYLLSNNSPTKGRIPDGWMWKWRSLFQLTDTELAELKNIYAQTDQINISNGIYTAAEVRDSRYSGSTFNSEIAISADVPSNQIINKIPE